MIALLTALDGYSIHRLCSNPSEAEAQLALSWLFQYSSWVGWLIGLKLWKEDLAGRPDTTRRLLRVLAASALVFAGLAAALRYTTVNPESWLPLFLFLLVYFIRLAPPAAASVVLSPFLVLSCAQKAPALASALLCQLGAWTGAYLLLGHQPDWVHAFLMFGMWIPNWGFGLLVGGALMRRLPPPDSSLESR